MKLEDRHIEALSKAEASLTDYPGYLELKRLLQSKDQESRARFRALFISYYNLADGYLPCSFHVRFFEVLFSDKVIVNGKVSIDWIFTAIGVHRRKNDHTCGLQFSFVSKLINIHKEDSPIYDQHVRNFFSTSSGIISLELPNAARLKSDRIRWFTGILKYLDDEYSRWMQDQRVLGIITQLKLDHPTLSNCHENRLIDFLIWTVGHLKLLKRKSKLPVPGKNLRDWER